MQRIKGRLTYHSYISPAPSKNMTSKQKHFLAKTYGELRERSFKGENKQVKTSASKLAWNITKKHFHLKRR